MSCDPYLRCRHCRWYDAIETKEMHPDPDVRASVADDEENNAATSSNESDDSDDDDDTKGTEGVPLRLWQLALVFRNLFKLKATKAKASAAPPQHKSRRK